MDPATASLAEALFKSQYSDPSDERVDRSWTARKPYVGYREAILRSELRQLGYDITPTDG